MWLLQDSQGGEREIRESYKDLSELRTQNGLPQQVAKEVGVSMPVTRTVMVIAKFTSTRWRGVGHYFGVGCVPTVESRKNDHPPARKLAPPKPRRSNHLHQPGSGVEPKQKVGVTTHLSKMDSKKELTFFLETVVTGEFCAKFFDTTGGVNVFQPACVERMASVTNIDFQFRFGAFGDERIPATAGHFRFDVFGVNAFFHGSNFPSTLYLQRYSTFGNHAFYHKNAQKQVGG